MISIAPETTQDHPLIDPLLNRVFGPDRYQKASYQYRADTPPIQSLSLVARDAQQSLIGSIRYWPMLLARQTVLLLGPLAIAPEWQRQGIGRWLTRDSLDLAQKMGYRVAFLVGDPGYYRHLGFVPAPATVTMPNEDPTRLQYRILQPDDQTILSGTLQPWRPVRSNQRSLDGDARQLRLVS